MRFCDQMGNVLELEHPPGRIVSLVPSQTELLASLGLDKEVIGITKFCIHPDNWFRTKTRIGGTKKLNIDLIRSLKPDLIIGNKEENFQPEIELLMRTQKVWMSDIKNLEDSLAMIRMIGEITGKLPEAGKIAEDISTRFSSLTPLTGSNKKALYLIWKDPYMCAGKKTFIDDMLSRCRFENVLKESRYPEITLSKIKELAPNFIFLSSEPYPFKEKHLLELKAVSPQSKVILVDGEMFSWYGSRLLKAPDYFKELILQLHL